MNPTDTVRYQAIRSDPVRGRTLLGEVDLDMGGMLALASAQLGSQALLQRLINLINAKPQLHVTVMPADGAPQFAQGMRGVTRLDPQFFDALQAFLFKHYGVFLSPGGPVDSVPAPATELS